MKHSLPAAYSRAVAVTALGLGAPWLAVYIYYQWTNLIPASWTWAWVQSFGWLLDTTVQWLVVLTLLRLCGCKLRMVFVGSGQWLAPTAITKVFVLLVLTGLSLDYLWQLPWFEIFPEKLAPLGEPTSQTFSDDEAIQVGPTIVTTLLMVTAGPIIEEIFYRGLILRMLGTVMPMAWAIALSSLLFGFFHPNDPLSAAFFSAILSIVYLHTRSLYSCIALHIAYNLRVALSELLSVAFPESWFRSIQSFRLEAWWLHATILAVSLALTIDYIRSVRGRSGLEFKTLE